MAKEDINKKEKIKKAKSNLNNKNNCPYFKEQFLFQK